MSTNLSRVEKTVEFTLRPIPPFRLDLTVWALRRRPDNLMDGWDGGTYRRVLAIGSHPVEVAVTQTGSRDKPHLKIFVIGSQTAAVGTKSEITLELRRMLGLQKDLSEFYEFAKRDRKLWELVDRFRGVKPPRFPTIFEAVVNGIACQQITLTQGIRLLNKLAEKYGLTVPLTGGTAFSFPTPAKLARLDPEDLRQLGFTRQKARAIIELAGGEISKSLDLESIADLDDQMAVERLMEVRGVGRWTAEYVLLRGLGRTNVFPGDDVGARNNLTRWLGLSEPLDYKGVLRVIQRFQPYGGLVYFHLLLSNVVRAGYVSSDGS